MGWGECVVLESWERGRGRGDFDLKGTERARVTALAESGRARLVSGQLQAWK